MAMPASLRRRPSGSRRRSTISGFWLRLPKNYELAEIEERADTIEVNSLPARSR